MRKLHLKNREDYRGRDVTYCGRDIAASDVAADSSAATCKSCLSKEVAEQRAIAFREQQRNRDPESLTWENIYQNWGYVSCSPINRMISVVEIEAPVVESPYFYKLCNIYGDPTGAYVDGWYETNGSFWKAFWRIKQEGSPFDRRDVSNPASLAATAGALIQAETPEQEVAVLLTAWAASSEKNPDWPVNMALFGDACAGAMQSFGIPFPWSHTMSTLLPHRRSYYRFPKPEKLHDVVFLASTDILVCSAYFELVKIKRAR